MNRNSLAVRFLYGTVPGRAILKLILNTHADRLAVWFLCSPLSRPLVGWYAKRNSIHLSSRQKSSFRSFRAFFVRERESVSVDLEPDHLISPCDGWLSACPIWEDSTFVIKDSCYRLTDLLQDEELARSFHGGDCLIFRLCPSDYHHYCYIDDGYQGENHSIPGALHSVQPLACERFPVYTRNRRCWTLMVTDHFGPVAQVEVGALIVGGIVNQWENTQVFKGLEKGRFELAGSTVVLLFQRGRVHLRPHIGDIVTQGAEYRVTQGMWIGTGGSTV